MVLLTGHRPVREQVGYDRRARILATLRCRSGARAVHSDRGWGWTREAMTAAPTLSKSRPSPKSVGSQLADVTLNSDAAGFAKQQAGPKLTTCLLSLAPSRIVQRLEPVNPSN